MATRAKEGRGGGGGGRRGGNSSSSSTSNQAKKPPTPAALKPSTSEKPLPNYLRPTISSSLDFSTSRSSRRSTIATTASSSTATTIKRHSYERPPFHVSTSTTTTFASLRPKSSTASTKTRPPVKPVPQRSFSSLSSRLSNKTPPSGPGPSITRVSANPSPANSSTSLNRVSRKAGPKSVTSESSVDFDPRDNVIVQDGKLDCQKEAKNEHVIVVVVEQQVAPCHKEEHDVGVEEGRGIQKNNEEIKTDYSEKEENHVVIEEERGIQKTNEGIETQDCVVTEEERSNAKIKTEVCVNEKKGEEDSTKVDEKHVVVELQGTKESATTSMEVVQVKTESPSINTVAKVKAEQPAKQQPRKKETQQAYNDVIEKTASKLIMENKRNKVRALAGAFETVISLQDNKPM